MYIFLGCVSCVRFPETRLTLYVVKNVSLSKHAWRDNLQSVILRKWTETHYKI